MKLISLFANYSVYITRWPYQLSIRRTMKKVFKGRGGNDGIKFQTRYHQNLDIFLCVWIFFRNFVCHKICPPHPNHFLKIQWEIRFFKRHFLGQNTPKTLHKFKTVVIQHFMKKTAFGFDLGPREGPKPETHEIRKCKILVLTLQKGIDCETNKKISC